MVKHQTACLRHCGGRAGCASPLVCSARLHRESNRRSAAQTNDSASVLVWIGYVCTAVVQSRTNQRTMVVGSGEAGITSVCAVVSGRFSMFFLLRRTVRHHIE